jgi:hypothetical protein
MTADWEAGNGIVIHKLQLTESFYQIIIPIQALRHRPKYIYQNQKNGK